MSKFIAGVMLIAVAAILPLHLPQTQKEEKYQQLTIQTEEVYRRDSILEDNAGGPSIQEPITLVRTIDGDTIKVKIKGINETVRYLLVDTPESKKEGMCVQPFAMEAFQRNKQLVTSGRLTLEFEPGNTRDSYGRLLAYVYVDGQSVQETLLKEGFARVAYIMNPEYKSLASYREDEGLAKRSRLNIWSHSDYVTKWGFNGCVQK
ncbi:thermonuclease family protein [Neobacillus pocheonensis]|uniref:thermonuclease family protein n=1 Tax=Neobacillus pocheonensis TaxID=363869 RepID=UPI003D2BE221